MSRAHDMAEENEMNGYAKIDQYNPLVVERIAEKYRAILESLGEDPTREGLVKTPERAAKALQFLTHGYGLDPAEILKSAMFRVHGDNAYGVLGAERGVHRLVRLSPFDSAHRRQTSFAQVDVAPELPPDAAIEIDDSDLRIDTYRSSGAGGQHVNKTDSAVRITHLPTGIVVQCQNERSQHANKDTALRALKSRLLEREEEARQAELLRERGILSDNAFGSQIRSYVLHPYTMVNDHRSGLKNGNAQGVLDGDLDPFISAFLLGSAAGTLGASDDGDDDSGEPA